MGKCSETMAMRRDGRRAHGFRDRVWTGNPRSTMTKAGEGMVLTLFFSSSPRTAIRHNTPQQPCYCTFLRSLRCFCLKLMDIVHMYDVFILAPLTTNPLYLSFLRLPLRPPPPQLAGKQNTVPSSSSPFTSSPRLLLASGGFRNETSIQFLFGELRKFFGEGVAELLFIPFGAKDHDACVKMHEMSGMAGGYKLKSINDEKDPLAAIKQAQGMVGGRAAGEDEWHLLSVTPRAMTNQPSIAHASDSSRLPSSFPPKAFTSAAGTFSASYESCGDAGCSRPCGRQ